MNCAYKRELEKKQIDRINQQEKDAVVYARCICLEWLQEHGMSKKTIQKVLDEVLIFIAEAFDKYRDETEEEFDTKTVPFLTKGMQNQVDALEIPIKEINEEYAIQPRRGMKQLTKTARYEKLKVRETAIRPYWYAFLVVLGCNHRFGKKKLTEFYRDIRARYKADWEYYMDCTPAGDVQISRTVKYVIESVSKTFKMDGSDGLFYEKKELDVSNVAELK